MNLLEEKVINLLDDLKTNHHILSVKAEFEDEGASLEEIYLLKSLIEKARLNLTLKIGGSGALNDIIQAKKIGVKSIVAPMIESPYALKKFIDCIKTVYQNESIVPEIFANIETISGFRNFDDIISVQEFEDLTGIVVGRFDMAKSIGLECKDCNGDKIFQLVNDIAVRMQATRKIFTVGGGVSVESLEFFKNISAPIQRIETRKIIFDADYLIKSSDEEAIIKAVNFEMLWLRLKRENYGFKSIKDSKRLEILQNRCNRFAITH